MPYPSDQRDPNWQGGFVVAGLGDGVAVATEPVLCRLCCFPTILGLVRPGLITFSTGTKVKDISGGTCQATPDW